MQGEVGSLHEKLHINRLIALLFFSNPQAGGNHPGLHAIRFGESDRRH
jgi:hypothetical protein